MFWFAQDIGPVVGSLSHMVVFRSSQLVLVIKNPPANADRPKRHRFDPCFRKIPWRRAWQPTPRFLPGESHGGSLAGCSPWDCMELDTIEAT